MQKLLDLWHKLRAIAMLVIAGFVLNFLITRTWWQNTLIGLAAVTLCVIAYVVHVKRRPPLHPAATEVYKRGVPRRIAVKVMHGERIVYAERPHPFQIVRWWLTAIAVTFIPFILWMKGIGVGIFLIAVVADAAACVRTIIWFSEWRLISEQRMLRVFGIITVYSGMLPLRKLDGVAERRPWGARFLVFLGFDGFCTLVPETAAQKETVGENLPYMRCPDLAFNLVQKLVLGIEAAATEDGTGP